MARRMAVMCGGGGVPVPYARQYDFARDFEPFNFPKLQAGWQQYLADKVGRGRCKLTLA